MSEIKDMISESVNRMFSKTVDRRLLDAAESGAWQQGLWDMVEQSGYCDVLAGEDADDLEGKWSDAFPVFHAIGFHRVPLPLSETIIARGLLARAGMPPCAGPSTVIQQQAGDQLKLQIVNHRLMLNGSAAAVPWAANATNMIVAGSADGQKVLGAIRCDAPGVSLRPGFNIAKEPRDGLSFEGAACHAFVVCGDRLPNEPVLLYGALARAAMIAGVVESVLRDSVQYANDRVQFGRLIGKFQAIQQSLAVLAGEVTSAQTAVLAACELAGVHPRWFDVAVAKVRSGQAAGLGANIGHQVHGAIGFTYEHSLHYATRRMWSWRAEFGADSVWARQLGRQAIQRGSSSFWSDLTRDTNAAR
jgi:acyl-CoA dehydrogenase